MQANPLGRVAASTRNQALAALLFLYREVLQVALPFIDGVKQAKRPVRVPVVLTREEATEVISRLSGVYKLMAGLLYGSGLRLIECALKELKVIPGRRSLIHEGAHNYSVCVGSLLLQLLLLIL